MSDKINMLSIIRAHYKTLRDSSKKKISLGDVFTFIIFPISMACLSALSFFNLNKDLDSLLVNFGAIFTALLLSVIVLIYDQENRILDKIRAYPEEVGVTTKSKLTLLKELYHNISYAIFCSLVLVALSFIHSIVPLPQGNSIYSFYISTLQIKLSFATSIVTPIIVFVTINIFLTILMVVKRLYKILVANHTE